MDRLKNILTLFTRILLTIILLLFVIFIVAVMANYFAYIIASFLIVVICIILYYFIFGLYFISYEIVESLKNFIKEFYSGKRTKQ